MQTITSKDNELIKHIRKLKDKKYRDESNEYVVEGVKLVEEAVKENAKIKQIIVCEDTTRTYEIPTHIMLEIAKYECISVSDKIFNIITQVTNPQGIMAIIEKNAQNAKIDYTQDIIVVLDDVQDPGNLGTILEKRSARRSIRDAMNIQKSVTRSGVLRSRDFRSTSPRSFSRSS